MREGGLLLSGTENSHTAAILAAISKVLPLNSARSENPVNEYESFAKLLYGAFPYLFVTGSGLPTTGGISRSPSTRLFTHVVVLKGKYKIEAFAKSTTSLK